MLPIIDTYQRHKIVAVKTADSWQGTIYDPRGDLVRETQVHSDSAGVFTQACKIIDSLKPARWPVHGG
jgi:hypothetical protein